jgi:hypothetical protein
MPDVNNPSDPTSPSGSEITPSESSSPVTPSMEKTSDRPHRFTLFALFGSLGLSVISLLVSLGSLYYTHMGMQVGQRAYLSFAPTYPDYKDDTNASDDDVILLTAEIEIKNLGNTPAYNVTPTVSPEKPDSTYQISSNQSIIQAIGPKEAVRIQVNISASRRSFRNGLKFPAAAPSMCSSASYTDVFGSAHSDKSCFKPAFKMTIEIYNPPRKIVGQ